MPLEKITDRKDLIPGKVYCPATIEQDREFNEYINYGSFVLFSTDGYFYDIENTTTGNCQEDMSAECADFWIEQKLN